MLKYVNTAKAKTKLIAYLKREKKHKAQKGETILNDFLAQNGFPVDTKVLEKLLNHYCLKKKEDLFYKIGVGEIETDDSLKKFLKGNNENVLMKYWKMSFGKKDGTVNKNKEIAQQEPVHKINRKETYILRELNGKNNYTIAACCCPIPGDDVLGYVNDNETVVVHKRSCSLATKLKSSFGPRIISAQWAEHNEKSFAATVLIKGIDSVGVLKQITRVITDNLSVNIKSLHIDTNEGIFEGKVVLNIHDVSEVEALCNQLKQIKEVKSANRISE